MTVCYWCGAKDTLADIGKELDDGKYKMVQCSKCKNAYYVVNKEKMNKPKPQTNEEWLRSATTEQLAEYLASTFDLCGAGCHHCFLANVCLTKAKNGNCLTQEQMIVEWLKQPHTKGDSE